MSIVQPMNRVVSGPARWRAQGPGGLGQPEGRIGGHQKRPPYHWLEPPRGVPPPQGLVDTGGEKLKGPRARGPRGPFLGWGALGAGVLGALEVHGALYVLGARACKGLGGRGERRAEAGAAVQAVLQATMHSSCGQVWCGVDSLGIETPVVT